MKQNHLLRKVMSAVLAVSMITSTMYSFGVAGLSAGESRAEAAKKNSLVISKKKVTVNVGEKCKVKYSSTGKVKAVSSKKKIAAAKVKKQFIVIKGIKKGSAKITVTCTPKKKSGGKSGKKISAKIKVTVKQPEAVNTAIPIATDAANAKPTHNPEKIKEAATRLSPFAGGVNSFGTKVFDGLRENNKNTFISPFSIYVALAMLANGASGNTQTEIMNTLGITDLAKWNSLILEYIKGSMDEKVTLNVGNSVWLGNRLIKAEGIERDFVNPLKTWYDSEVKQDIDFTSNETVNLVNKWIEEKTDGMIKKMLDSFDPYVMMLLINTLFFEGRWSEVFSEEATADETFHGSLGDSTIKMMRKSGEFYRYFKDSKFKGIELPYGTNGSYAMDILMSSDDNVSTIDGWKNLTEADKMLYLRGFEDAYMQNIRTLKLPKFSLEYKTDDKLKGVLQNIGIKEAFKPLGADLTKIGRGPDGPLYVSDVLHNTALEVNENGSRAAAATVVVVKEASAIRQTGDPIDFIVDRPFIFTIRDRVSGMILFIGEVSNL